MLTVALVLAALAALVHVYIFVIESLQWEKPSTLRAFGMSAEQAAVMKPLAYNQGFYNLFLALEVAVGIAPRRPTPQRGCRAGDLRLRQHGCCGAGVGEQRRVQASRCRHPGGHPGAGTARPAGLGRQVIVMPPSMAMVCPVT